VAELRAWGADLYEFLKALGRKWKSGVTGGILAVVLSLTGIFSPLPKHVVAAAVIGYVIIAAFYAWREQYLANARLDTPLQKRKKLDSLVNEGEDLLNLVKMGKNPEARAERWDKVVMNFVGQNFMLSQHDELKWRTMSVEEVLSMRFDVQDEKREAVAIQIGDRLQGLRELRESIRD
jgi:hypothetical protein